MSQVRFLHGSPELYRASLAASLPSLKTPESDDYKIDSQKEAISVGQVVKLPQPDSWESFLELFLFERKAEVKLLALFPIISFMHNIL